MGERSAEIIRFCVIEKSFLEIKNHFRMSSDGLTGLSLARLVKKGLLKQPERGKYITSELGHEYLQRLESMGESKRASFIKLASAFLIYKKQLGSSLDYILSFSLNMVPKNKRDQLIDIIDDLYYETAKQNISRHERNFATDIVVQGKWISLYDQIPTGFIEKSYLEKINSITGQKFEAVDVFHALWMFSLPYTSRVKYLLRHSL